MDVLPQELIESIIDEASPNPSDLKSLSLVARAFLPRTRDHLFRQVRITSCRRCHTFRALCCSSPDVAHHVKTLTLNFFYYNKLDESQDLPDMIISLIHADVLVIEGCCWVSLLVEARQALLSHPFRSITLSGASFPNLNTLCTFINSSPALKSLSLSSIGIADHARHLHNHGPTIPIDRLLMDDPHGLLRDSALNQACPFSLTRVHSIAVIMERPQDYDGLRSVLHATVHVLEELTVFHRGKLAQEATIADLPTRLDLAHIIVLKLALQQYRTLTVGEVEDFDLIALRWWIASVGICVSLQKLVIHLFLRSDAAYRDPGDFGIWSELDDALSHLSSLREVSMLVKSPYAVVPREISESYVQQIRSRLEKARKVTSLKLDIRYSDA